MKKEKLKNDDSFLPYSYFELINSTPDFVSFKKRLPRHAHDIIIKDANDIEFSFKMFTSSDLSNLLESCKKGNEYKLKIWVGKCPVDGNIYRNDTLDQCTCKIKREKGELSGM